MPALDHVDPARPSPFPNPLGNRYEPKAYESPEFRRAQVIKYHKHFEKLTMQEVVQVLDRCKVELADDNIFREALKELNEEYAKEHPYLSKVWDAVVWINEFSRRNARRVAGGLAVCATGFFCFKAITGPQR